MAGNKYWDVMYTLHLSTSLQMPNIELHRPGIEPGPPPDRIWTLCHWAMESIYNMGVLVIHYVPVLLSKCQILNCIGRELNPGPPDRMWMLTHWAMESVHDMGVLVIHYVPVLLSKCQILKCIVRESNWGPPTIEYGRSAIELWNLYIKRVC